MKIEIYTDADRVACDRNWEHVQAAGNVTSITIDKSKVNVIFAVRAVDKAGHRSLPIVPTPER